MSASRQARRERRAAERKTAKLARKAAKAAGSENGFVSQNTSAASGPFGFVSQNPAVPAPESGFVSQPAAVRAEINRQNAQHSTGPRSSTGKSASSRNSLKHGLASGTLIIPGEDPAALEALRKMLLEEHQPANETEALLIKEMAQSFWLTKRAIRLQNECFTENGVDNERTGRLVPVVRVDKARLALLLRYQTTHDRAFYKALDTLGRLQKERRRNQAGFVSQKTARAAQHSGFVSQNDPKTTGNDGFVSHESLGTPPNPLTNTRAA